VQLGGFLLNSDHRFQNDTCWLEGNTPADPAAARYALLKYPLPAGDIGEAFAAGVCVALVNVGDTSHTHATPAASATVLDSAASGPIEILSPLTDTGEQQVWVRLGTSPTSQATKALVRFTLDAALTLADASQDATIVAQYGTGVDNSDTAITVHNLATAASGYVFEGAIGAAGLAMHDSGQNYRIIQLECPA
jgi:hypothetical protein